MSILIILAAALLGAIAGTFIGGRYRFGPGGRKATMTLSVMAGIAALGTNSSEALVQSGLDFTAVDVIEAASYFLFGFAAAAGWRLATPPAVRWLFAILVPIAMYEPLRIGWRLIKVLIR